MVFGVLLLFAGLVEEKGVRMEKKRKREREKERKREIPKQQREFYPSHSFFPFSITNSCS